MTRNTQPQGGARQPGLGEPGHMASGRSKCSIPAELKRRSPGRVSCAHWTSSRPR